MKLAKGFYCAFPIFVDALKVQIILKYKQALVHFSQTQIPQTYLGRSGYSPFYRHPCRLSGLHLFQTSKHWILHLRILTLQHLLDFFHPHRFYTDSIIENN